MELPPVEIRNILYATDLSENARLAYAWAANLADRYCAVLTTVHVVEEDPDLDERVVGYIGAAKWEEIKARNAEEARQTMVQRRRSRVELKAALDSFCDLSGRSNAPAEDEVVVRRGHPVEQVLDEARRRSVDLIVCGSNGIGSLADAVIGSTARRLVRRSKIPVLVVRLPED